MSVRPFVAAVAGVWLGLLACGGGPEPSAPAPAPAPAVTEPAPPPAPHPNQPTERAVFGYAVVDWVCMTCGELGDFQPTVSASSTRKGPYTPDSALGTTADAWCEGDDGDGVGATFTITLGRPAELDAIGVWGGFFKSDALLRANNRIRTLRLTTDAGADEVIAFADPAEPLTVDPSSGNPVEGPWIDHVTKAAPPWHGVRTGRGRPVSRITLEILEVYPGERHRDTCIARIDAQIMDPDQADP